MSVLLALLIFTQSQIMASALTDDADKAYQNEDYDRAISLYREVIDKEGVSSDLLYNLGNAYYRTGDIAHAILSYERSLRLNPANDDAKANLEFVNDRIVDKKGETGSFIYNTIESVTNFTSSNNWAWIALILFILAVAGAIVYIFSETILLRKLGFFGGALSLILAIVGIALSFNAKSIASDRSTAIITAETTILSTVPRQPVNRDEEAMLLHEGTKVRILRTIAIDGDSTATPWHEVEVDNRHRAWINDADIEKIIP